MKNINQEDHYLLYNALIMLNNYIFVEDLSSDGRDIYYNWTSMIEKELKGMLDENDQIELTNHGIATIPKGNVSNIRIEHYKASH